MNYDALIAFIVFQGVFLFLDIYIYIKTNRDIARKGEYQFFGMLIFIHVIYLWLNSIWTLGEYGLIRLSKPAATVLCMGSLLSVTGCAFVFFLFTIEKIRFIPLQKKPWRLLCILPEAVTAGLILTSPLTGWVFTLDEESNFIHGPVYSGMLIVASLYLVAVAGIAGYNMKTARTSARRRSSGALLLSVLIIILFVVFDDMIMKASILPAAVFAVITVIFISMQESNINSDALTGMNNRRKADEYLSNELPGVSAEKPLILYLGDLNGFKSINDIYGHLEGDEALVTCGEVLKRTVSHCNGFAARFGGDEFLLSRQMSAQDAEDPDELIREINKNLEEQTREKKKPYSLSMCVGYAVCADRSETLNSCIRRADEMLYRKKQEFYRSGSRQEKQMPE